MQCRTKNSVVLSKQKPRADSEEDLEGTQLTAVNCSLGSSSSSSLNNNSGCPDGGDVSLSKSVCISVPALEPNG